MKKPYTPPEYNLPLGPTTGGPTTRMNKAEKIPPSKSSRGRKPVLTNHFMLTNDDTMRCLIMAGLGFSTKFISSQTGLTRDQICFRLYKAGLKRKFYRDGESKISRKVLSATDRIVEQALEKRLMKQPLRFHGDNNPESMARL